MGNDWKKYRTAPPKCFSQGQSRGPIEPMHSDDPDALPHGTGFLLVGLIGLALLLLVIAGWRAW